MHSQEISNNITGFMQCIVISTYITRLTFYNFIIVVMCTCCIQNYGKTQVMWAQAIIYLLLYKNLTLKICITFMFVATSCNILYHKCKHIIKLSFLESHKDEICHFQNSSLPG